MAWAGEQLPVISGTGVIIGEDLMEGHSWPMGVVLLVTVGVGLLSCVCVLCSIRTCQLELYMWQENQRLHGSQAT